MAKSKARQTREAARLADLKREADAQKKKAEKAEKRLATSAAVKKKKKKGIKLRKNVMVKGVRVRDAASKQEALRRLQLAQANAMALG